MELLNRPFITYLYMALLAAAALFFIYLFVNGIRRRGLNHLRVFSLIVTAVPAIICLMYMPGAFISPHMGMAGLSLMDYLPLHMVADPLSDAGRLVVRLTILLFFLVITVLLMRKRHQQTVLAVTWFVFLAVNLAAVALHTYRYINYEAPPALPQQAGDRLNPAAAIFEHVVTPRSSWWRHSFFPIVWVALSVTALLKLAYEMRLKRTTGAAAVVPGA